MIGVYFRHARGNPDTSYDEIWEMESPFLLYATRSGSSYTFKFQDEL
ncbi:hypothetical protein [Leptospira santarosai]|nr:hypothetical protein [Leptospira santarosai]